MTVEDILLQQLDAIAASQSRSRDAALSDAIAAYIEQQRAAKTPSPENDPLLALVAQVTSAIPAEASAQTPTDLARNYKHYLYGAEKEG